MPFKIYDQETILKDNYAIINVHIVAPITWDTYDKEMRRLAEITGNTEASRVYIILTADVEMPVGNPLPHFSRTLEQFSDISNFRLMISVYPKSVAALRMFIGTIMRIYSRSLNSQFPAVKSIEEAMALIEKDHHS